MQFFVALRNARLSQIATTVGASPLLQIYTGTPPGAANAASGTLLVSIPLPATWTAAPANGAMALSGTWTATAAATGTPGYFRLTNTAGSTVYIEGTCGVGTGDLNFTAGISLGGAVTVTGFTMTEGNP